MPLNILVVEDNPDAQQMICELIAMLGYCVSCASDSEQAWELILARQFDILLTDVSLPGMSGIALAGNALGRQPGLRVIFSTGYDKDWLEGIGFQARMLRKPFDLTELKAALDNSA